MYKDALNSLFYTVTAQSPMNNWLTNNSKVAIQIQPITRQGFSEEKGTQIQIIASLMKKKYKRKKQHKLLQCAMRSKQSHRQKNRNHFEFSTRTNKVKDKLNALTSEVRKHWGGSQRGRRLIQSDRGRLSRRVHKQRLSTVMDVVSTSQP